MDTGLKNINTLGELYPEFKDVVFLVEANSNEVQNLWCEWAENSQHNIKPVQESNMVLLKDESLSKVHPYLLLELVTLNNAVSWAYNKYRVKWEQITSGFAFQIGTININEKDWPVMLEFSFAILNGKKVGFYNCCSAVQDHNMVDQFLKKHFQLTHDNYTRWNVTDAQNFHNCINSLNNLDKNARE